ncbi:hypothetical protein M8C21_023298 [Ambrosia artemisiifolia]|uniref:Uncharacterized protein n=1 Tax=Ambrosia artemisiifolia TaxID=4212 RepID=A0AAD5DA25_AMBAR|nr:hypothetical protein M8C21_023298 [Ambrosia artemisiifolia]
MAGSDNCDNYNNTIPMNGNSSDCQQICFLLGLGAIPKQILGFLFIKSCEMVMNSKVRILFSLDVN